MTPWLAVVAEAGADGSMPAAGQGAWPAWLVAIPVVGAILVFTALYLGIGRGRKPSPDSPLLAEEVESAPAFAVLMLAAALLELRVVLAVPPAGQVVLALSALVLAGASAAAWDGFHYLFRPSGLEIRSLGFRLRSIPAEQITGFEVGRWSALGGYGVRGLGNRRAYVWGNRGVRITTEGGQVFLGHRDPQRILEALHAMQRAPR